MEALVQDLIKAFGWSILNSVWQSGIIYAVLLTILLTAPKLSAKLRHNLAYGSVCAMFAWFLFTFFNHIDFSAPKVQVSSKELSQIGFYLSQFPETLSQKAEGYFPFIVSAYLAGIIVQLFVIIKGYVFLRKLKTTQLSVVPEAWLTTFNSITGALGLNKKIDFKLSALVNVPVVVGYLKPIVLFPVSLVTQLDNEQVEAILIHELSHIRRNDYLLNLIKTCIETLMFFNPFVWLASKFIHIEREHACDDLVLKLSGKPLTYAHALLKLELVKENAAPAYALAATGKTQYLYQRIKRITNMKTNYLNTKQQMAALTLAVAGLLSVAWTNPTVKQKAKEVTHKISQTFTLSSEAPVQLSIHSVSDTTKKKTKMKIVVTQNDGTTKEYNSVSELPDSLRKTFRVLNPSNFSYSVNMDSLGRYTLFTDSAFKFRTLNGDFARIYTPAFRSEMEKFSKDLQKEFNSPEAIAKWKKFQDEIKKEYDSPEAKAKWQKIREDIAKEFNTPEAKAKWKKMAEDMQAKMNSPEFKTRQRALISKFGTEARIVFADSLNKKHFKALASLNFNTDSLTNIVFNNKTMNLAKLKDLNTHLRFDTVFNSRFKNLSSNFNYISIDDKDVRNSSEYKALKEKFDKEVDELRKKIKEEKKDDKKDNKTNQKPARKMGAISVGGGNQVYALNTSGTGKIGNRLTISPTVNVNGVVGMQVKGTANTSNVITISTN